MKKHWMLNSLSKNWENGFLSSNKPLPLNIFECMLIKIKFLMGQVEVFLKMSDMFANLNLIELTYFMIF
jgi:hypothetical protein